MKLLLDTCALLWALQDAGRLSLSARRALRDPENTVSVSVVSFLEISLKSSLGQLRLHGTAPEDIPRYAKKADWQISPLVTDVAAISARLPRPTEHCDPFDRWLVWSAVRNDFGLVSRDYAMQVYVPRGLKICW